MEVCLRRISRDLVGVCLWQILMSEMKSPQALAYVVVFQILCRRQLIYDLLDGLPIRRSFGYSITTFFGWLVPSGIVPDDEVTEREWNPRREIGGAGPDRFSDLCPRVLFAKGAEVTIILIFRVSSI